MFEPGFPQGAAEQIHAVHVGAAQAGAGKVTVPDIRAAQRRAGKIAVREHASGGTHLRERAACGLHVRPYAAFQRASGNIALFHACAVAEGGSFQTGGTEARAGEHGVVHVRPVEIRPGKDGLSQIIINVEAQKDEPQRYGILYRAVFYVSRLISSQKERDFENTEYDDIKRVYSIWVCMNMEENSLSHIHLVKDDLVGYHDWRGKLDLFNIVMIGLAKELPGQGEQYELHRLLGALFAEGLTAGERLNIIKEEYDIPIEQTIEQEVDVMCNLSQGIKETGIAEGRAEEIIETGYEFGLSEQDILERLQKKLSISLQKAQEYLLMFGKRTV